MSRAAPAAPNLPPQRAPRWALLLGLGVLVACGGGWWFFARPKSVASSEVLERFVGRWAPDWEGMQGQPGTLGSRMRGAAGAAQAALAVDSWKRKGIVLDVLPSGEVHVVASAEPDAPVTSRHAATVEGEQLRLRGIESSGKPLPSAYVSVLRLRRDGVLLWIPLYGASGELTVLLRRP